MTPVTTPPPVIAPPPAQVPPAGPAPATQSAPAVPPVVAKPAVSRKTWMYIAIGLLVSGGLAAYFVLRPRANPWVWYTTVVEVQPLDLTVTATGTLAAVRTVAVGTQVSGVIEAIYVDYNTRVTKGEVIAQLDKTTLSSTLADATSTLDKAQVQARQSQLDLTRAAELYANKVIARVEYETARTTHQSNLTTIRSARTGRDRAQINLRFATIHAPISGVIVDRKVDVGQTVAANFNTPTLFTIANDLTQMQVEADVDEADIGQVKNGQAVRFEVDAYPGRVFRGTVQQIRLQPVVTQSVVTYTVIIAVPNPDLTLLPGLTANLTIATQHYPAAPTVPASALTFTPPADFERLVPAPATLPNTGAIGTVWVVQGDSLRAVRVRPGASDGVRTQVAGALRAGQPVVTGRNIETAGKTTAPTSSTTQPKAQRGGGMNL